MKRTATLSKRSVKPELLQQQDMSSSSIAYTAASFFALAENAPDIICRFDRAFCHLYVNPAIERITGIPTTTFIGRATTEVGLPPEFSAFWNSQIDRVFETRMPALFEFSFPTVEGMKYFHSSVVPEFGLDGGVVSVLSISRDITAIREHEQEKDAFLAVVTHELKSPVTTIKALAQLLQKRLSVEGDKETVSFLVTMDTQLDRLTQRIGDLLDATRLGAGKMQFQREQFHFDTLLKDVVNDMRTVNATHTIVLRKPVRVTLLGDRERIRQVLLNLLANSLKYSPNASPVIVRSYIKGNSVFCSVKDSGPGIPQEQHEKLFQRFSRLTEEYHPDSPGLGLGLYISAEIIKQSGGKIWVESSAGKGARFCFQLPLMEGN